MIKQDTTSLLKAEHLFKSFQAQVALNDINLEIPTNSVLGLLGPNGAGKTTLLRIFSGLLQPDAGIISRTGIKIGYCPQSPVFWKKLTVIEQLSFNSDLFLIPRVDSVPRVKFLLNKLGLLDYQNKLVEQISGGMQKRLNFALALVHHPDLLILDEPTANLDLESKELVRNLIIYLVKEEDMTIICSSHDLEEISNISTEVIFMDKGQIKHQTQIKKEMESDFDIVKLKDLYMNVFSSQVAN